MEERTACRAIIYGSTLVTAIIYVACVMFLFHPLAKEIVPLKLFYTGIIGVIVYLPVLLLKIFSGTGEWTFQAGIISYRSLWRVLLSRPAHEICEISQIRSVEFRPSVRVRVAYQSYGEKLEASIGWSSSSLAKFFIESLKCLGFRFRVQKVGSGTTIYLKGGDPDDDDQDIDPI